jgi:hypothetical protein
MFGKIIFFLCVTCCFVPGTLGSQANTPSAKIEGTVFVRDSAGNQTFVSGATVRLDGPATLEAETDANGKYVVAAVPFGTYTVEVALPGLKALRTIQVEGSEVRLPLELRPMEVTTSVVVTPDPAETKDPAPSETISEKTLRDAPNVNEHFESLLPLFTTQQSPFSNRISNEYCASCRVALSLNNGPLPLLTSPRQTAVALRSITRPFQPDQAFDGI